MLTRVLDPDRQATGYSIIRRGQPASSSPGPTRPSNVFGRLSFPKSRWTRGL